MTKLVICSPALLVGEHLVCLCALLEPCFGIRVIRIPVRVILHRQAAIGTLDVIGRNPLLDTKDLVIVTSC